MATQTRNFARRAALASSLAVALLFAAARVHAQEAEKVTGRNAALKAAFKDVATKASSSAVKLATTSGGARGYGVVLEGGFVVTAATNVKGVEALVAKNRQGDVSATVLGVDEDLNLALLKLKEAPKGAAVLGSSSGLEIGQFIVAVGGGDEALAAGVVSAKDRRVEPRDLSGNVMMGLFSDGNDGPKRAYAKVLQHDAPITTETIGSALVDGDGKVVGMNVDTAYRGSCYALGIDEVKGALERLKKGERTLARPAPAPRETKPTPAKPKGRARLGLSGRTPTDDERQKLGVAQGGVLVEELVTDGPAVRGGLHPGDLILSVDGQVVADLEDLAAKIKAHSAGDEIVIAIRRAKEKVTLKVKLGAAE